MPKPGLPVTEIAAGSVHNEVHEEASAANDDAIANIGFIIGDDAVAVIDPGGSFVEGQALRAAIQARTDRPIRYVILTHVHPDHIFGAGAFRDDHPDFVGHAKLPGALAQRGDYYLRRLHDAIGDAARGSAIVPPTVLVADRLDLESVNRRLTLRACGPAHTDNDMTVFDEKTRTLWLADLLFVDRIPVIDGSLVGWLKQLDELTAIPADRAVPGTWSGFRAMAGRRRTRTALSRCRRARYARGHQGRHRDCQCVPASRKLGTRTLVAFRRVSPPQRNGEL